MQVIVDRRQGHSRRAPSYVRDREHIRRLSHRGCCFADLVLFYRAHRISICGEFAKGIDS